MAVNSFLPVMASKTKELVEHYFLSYTFRRYERRFTMLDKKQMQEIQDLKLRGFTKGEIITYYEGQGIRPPSRPTINKYYKMDVVPDDPGAKLKKDKAFDHEPFKSTIIAIITAAANEGCHISSVYDVLMEKFIENGDYDTLPGNEQTLRNYVRHLEESGQASRDAKNRRIYDQCAGYPSGGADAH
jgi:hypothetical protein